MKVTDFGIARADSGEPLTKTGAVLGTATYFSPEQAQGFALDGRSDVYALGVVLYEMLTGVAPFTAASPVSVAYKHVRETPAPPSSVEPDVPGAMDRIVLTAMAKDVDERYQSAQDLRGDLLRFERGRPLVGAPVTAIAAPVASTLVAAPVVAPAPPPPAPPPVPTPRKGRWGPIVAVGMAMALLIALIVVLLVQSDIGGGDSPPPSLDVPRVTGLPFGQAEAGLKAMGFKVARTDDEAPQQAPDLVLGQDPEEGRKLVKGGLITLRVSGPNIKVPAVAGQTRDNATRILAQSNLVPKFVEQDSDQPPGTVLGTYPVVGAPVAKLPSGGSPEVAVAVAREPAIPVPDVSGQDETTARATLVGAGFQVTSTPTSSDSVDVGKVIGTNPAAGTPLPRNTAVSLLVSTGPDLVDRAEHRRTDSRRRRGAPARQPRVRVAGDPRERGPDALGSGDHAVPERWAAAEGLHHRPHDRSVTLARWYDEHGRHDLPWRVDPRPMGDPRVGGDAPPDAGAPGGRRVRRVPSTVPDPGRDGRRRSRRGDRGLGAARATRGGPAACTTPRW